MTVFGDRDFKEVIVAGPHPTCMVREEVGHKGETAGMFVH